MRIIKLRKKRKIIFLICFTCISTITILASVLRSIKPRLLYIGEQYVQDAMHRVVEDVVQGIDYDKSTFYSMEKSSNGEIATVEFDTKKLNQYLYHALDILNDSLIKASKGERDTITDEIYYSEGIIYKIPVGDLTNIFFMFDQGFSIPIKMRVLQSVDGKIVPELKPYGINSTMVLINLQVQLETHVEAWLFQKKVNSSIDVPIVMHIIHGNTPAATASE